MIKGSTEILYGLHPVTEALKAGRRPLEAIYVRRGKAEARVGALLRWAAMRHVPVRYVDEPQLRA